MQKSLGRIDSLDCLRLFLSVVIVQIHAMGSLNERVFSRVAVPLFFLISAFLFFRKYDRLPECERSAHLWRAVLRIGRLYLFWFVLLLPVVLFHCGFFDRGIAHGIFKIGAKAFLGSTFPSSWYLGALAVGLVLVARSPRRPAVTLAVISFCICVLASNYRNLFPTDGLFQRVFVVLYPGTFYLSFPAGLLWIVLGRMMANGKFLGVPRPALHVALALSSALLAMEYCLISHFGLSVDNNDYFLLVPLVCSIFLVVLRMDLRVRLAEQYRKISTMMYCLHGSLLIYVREGCFGEWFNQRRYFPRLVSLALLVCVCVWRWW